MCVVYWVGGNDISIVLEFSLQSLQRHFFKHDWIMCSKCARHIRSNNSHDHSMNTKNSTLIMNKIFMKTSKNYETNDYGHNFDLLIISHQLCLFKV